MAQPSGLSEWGGHRIPLLVLVGARQRDAARLGAELKGMTLPAVRIVGPDADRSIETAGGAGITRREATAVIEAALPDGQSIDDFVAGGRAGTLTAELANLWNKYGFMY